MVIAGRNFHVGMLLGFWVFFGVLAACAGPRPEGLTPKDEGSKGPMVIYDPLRKPTPEVPFPNDSATRLVDFTATGRLINVSLEAPLHSERHLRELLNRIDGFSVSSAITVSFEAPIDLNSVHEESFLVVDVRPDSPEYGAILPLDFKGEHYPINMKPRALYPYDPQEEIPDMLFPEDNIVDGERVTNYEVATNTLIVRTIYPMRPKTTYAVVLTKDIVGLEGQPILSPFEGVNHANQTEALRPVLQHVDNVAFAWTFTTQSVTEELEIIRDGLDGKGILSELKEHYPGRFAYISDLEINGDGDGTFEDKGIPLVERDHRYIMQPIFLEKVIGGIAGAAFNMSLSFEYVDYFVLGAVEVPDLRDESGVIYVDPINQNIHHELSKATFLLSVPKIRGDFQPPFPVIIYNHGARTARLELAVVADLFAQYGYAMIGIDAVGHGPFGGDLEKLIAREAAEVPQVLIDGLMKFIAGYLFEEPVDMDGMSIGEALELFSEVGLWEALFIDGRAEDLDGDGVLLSGDGYFLPNSYELSASTRQTIVDNLVLYRLIRGLSQDAIPSEALDNPREASDDELLPYLMAGDFNADGILDIGGPGNRTFAAGTSLGGIHTSILIAIEPDLKTAVPIVSGGGMIDIMVRTSLADAVSAVLLEILGPTLVGCPAQDEDGKAYIALSWDQTSLGCRDEVTIEWSEVDRLPVVPGGRIILKNPRLIEEGGEAYADESSREVILAEDGGFSISVAADLGDNLELRILDEEDEELFASSYLSVRDGLGLKRNSPRFRRVIQLAQIGVDRGDPLAYALHLVREPLKGMEPRNVLHLADIGDRVVPFSTMVSWDRAVGLLGLDQEKALEISNLFVDHNALDGKKPYWDIDDLFDTGDGVGPLPPIETISGVSAVRYPATDDHEYIGFRDPEAEFDWTTYSRNQMLWFFETDGKEISDDFCLEVSTCDWMQP